MYLNIPKLVTRAQRPSVMSSGTQEMLDFLEVKEEATDASASDREIPALAALRAPQSLAPSPHMPAKATSCVIPLPHLYISVQYF